MEAIFAQIQLHGAVGILTYCLLGRKTFEIHCATDAAEAGSNLQFVNLRILIILLLFFGSSSCQLNCMHSRETHRTFSKFRREAQHLAASLAGCFKNNCFLHYYKNTTESFSQWKRRILSVYVSVICSTQRITQTHTPYLMHLTLKFKITLKYCF